MDFIGKRIIIDNSFGTVRFHGELPGIQGTFFGVEWDDIAKGKHSGKYKHSQIFTTDIENSATFINDSRVVDFGRGFIIALNEKYAGSLGDSTISLGSKIVAETVGWEKISNTLRNLRDLKEVFLANYSICGLLEEKGVINQVCPSIQDLDLSRNLLMSFKDVCEIISEMRQLHTLRLNSNRLSLDFPILYEPFIDVKILTLSNTNLKWKSTIIILHHFSAVSELHLGSNAISTISSVSSDNISIYKNLKILNLEHNNLDWSQVLNLGFLNLETLILNSNRICEITPVVSPLFKSLQSIILTHNLIDQWSYLDSLNSLEGLVDLKVSHIPLFDSLRYTQKHTTLIARITNLTKINGIAINHRERLDAELYYLNQCALVKDTLADFDTVHPIYKYLCGKHGEPGKALIKCNILTLKFSNGQTVFDKKVSLNLKVRQVKTMVARTLYPKKWQSVVNGHSPLVWIHAGLAEELDDPMKDLDAYDVCSGDHLVLKDV